MKIVIDARESGTSTGRYVDKLIEYLHKLKPKHDIVVLTKEHRVEYLKKIAPTFDVLESNFKEFTFAEQFGLLKQIKGLKADLVHFPIVQQPILYHGRVVTTMNDLTTLRFRNPAKKWLIFTVKRWIYRWVNFIVAHKSKALIAYTQFVKNDIAKFARLNKHKITVTYLAADELAGNPEAIPELMDRDFIMFNGRPLPHKNLRRLIEAFAFLHEKYPNLLLVIAGKKDASFKSYLAFVKKLSIEDKVIFTDYIPDSQLKWAIQNTKAYIYPSLSEGFGIPGLEAMYYGAPLVSSDATCLPEVYGDAAHYFNPLDIQDIADKIDEVLSSYKLRQDLIKKGSEQVKKYSWETMAEQTLAVYREVLKK